MRQVGFSENNRTETGRRFLARLERARALTGGIEVDLEAPIEGDVALWPVLEVEGVSTGNAARQNGRRRVPPVSDG